MRIRTVFYIGLSFAMTVLVACGGSDDYTANPQSWPTAAATSTSSQADFQSARYSYQPSTPGLNPPNDEPYADTFFQSYGVNPFIATEDQRFSTFGMDVDTASYTISRAYIQAGDLPPADAVRVEEFVNYFGGDYPSPGDGLDVYIDGARSRFGEDNKHLLRVGIAAAEVALDERKPVVLTFVIDVSGSMDMQNRLELAKRSLERMVDGLGPEDMVGIVVYGSNARSVLDPTSDKESIARAIRSLRAEGSTNAEAGLLMGYRVATEAFAEGKTNRVVLISDGVANVGRTGPDSILSRVRAEANNQITLTTIGVGMGNYNDILMERLANDGDGNYFYVDTDAEARDLFGGGLIGVLETVALDAKVQVEFNPAVVDRFRLIGYENRALDTEDFRDDTVDAGEVGAGHTVTALSEVRIKDGATGSIATVSIRYEDPDTGEVIERSREVTMSEVDRPFEDASPAFQFTAAVGEFAEILRDSHWAEDGTLEAALEVASQAVDDMESTSSQRELVSLVSSAMSLRR